MSRRTNARRGPQSRERATTTQAASAPDVLFVGVLPGPKNGMTLLTEFLLDDLQRRGPNCAITVIDIGRHFRSLGRGWQVRRSIGALQSAVRIARHRSDSARTCVYLVGNSDSGLPLSALQAAAARFRRFRIVYHHHTTASIDDPRMRLVIACCGSDSVHVVSGTALEDHLLDRFPDAHTLQLAPSVRALNGDEAHPTTRPAEVVDDRLTIGHVSNLTRDKGVMTVIRTVRELAVSGVSCRAIVVGPFTDARVEADARAEAEGLDVSFTGQLVDDELAAATSQFDVFLFPSTYRHESWAMVIDEVLTQGIPVITTRFPGAERIGRGGSILNDGEPNPRDIAVMIKEWHREPGVLPRLQRAAFDAAHRLRSDGEHQLENFRRTVCGQSTISEALDD